MRLEKSEKNRPGKYNCLFHCSKVNGSKTLPDQIQMRRAKHFDKKNLEESKMSDRDRIEKELKKIIEK